MPLSVRVDPEVRVIFVEGAGAVTDEELVGYVSEYLTREEFRDFDEFFDFSSADLLDLTFTGLSNVAAEAAATDPEASPTKIGILVAETQAMGVSRLYQSLREAKGGRRQTRVFWDRTECREWLGLTP